jgi:hypothetical protein
MTTKSMTSKSVAGCPQNINYMKCLKIDNRLLERTKKKLGNTVQSKYEETQ